MVEKTAIELLWQIGRNVEEILFKIDRLVSLYELGQKNEFNKLKEEVLGRSEVRRQVYELCDGARTVQEIAKQVRKPMPQVSIELARLEEAGLIKPTEAGRKRYYSRII